MLEARGAFLVGAVELDQQRRAGVEAIAGAGRLLGRLNRQAVHHLDRPGDDPGAHDLGHGLSGRARVLEERDQRAHALGQRDHAQGDLRRDSERPLRAYERAEQVVAGRVAIELEHLAV